MTFRKILVPLQGTAYDQSALQSALSVGRQFGAHVEALFVFADPYRIAPATFIGGETSAYTAQAAVDAAREASEAAYKQASATFTQAIGKFGIEINAQPGARADSTATLKTSRGDAIEEVERASRLADLVVFADLESEIGPDLMRDALEAVLLSGSRPILCVPAGGVDAPGHRIAIAYDGSASAAHAVSAALPFLARAKGVHSYEVRSQAGESGALAELREFLALRGIESVEHIINPGGNSTGEALMTAVTSQHCDLLVLGGYGHSRMREFVLGGVTRSVLRKRNTLPVLMAH